MKKFLFIVIILLQYALAVYCYESFIPFAWSGWQLWKSPFGDLPLSNGNFLPYPHKMAFFPVKGYNHCIMRVYEAGLKFWEITPNDDPFIIFEIDYDEKGRVVEYVRTNLDTFGGINRVVIERNGDRVLSESHYNSKGELIGTALYKYDEYNRLSVIDLIDRNNRIYKKTKYAYNSAGQAKLYEYNSDGAEQCVASDTRDSKGRLIRQTYTEGGATIVETITYNEKGFIDKINSSKTFVLNGRKDEIFKGKLFDLYKYRFDQYGNVTDRLDLHNWMGNESLEWIKCEYSNVDNEVVEVVEDTNNTSSDFVQSNLESTNPNDYLNTIRFNDLYYENSDQWHLLQRDMDNDGIDEYLYWVKQNEGCGLVVYGCKILDEGKRYHNRYVIPLEEKTINTCTLTVMLHDFDNDGKNEVILAWIDMAMFINGRVFKWKQPSDASPDCFLEVGQFYSSFAPHVDGNTLTTKVGLIGGTEKKYIYKNNKLELQK